MQHLTSAQYIISRGTRIVHSASNWINIFNHVQNHRGCSGVSHGNLSINTPNKEAEKQTQPSEEAIEKEFTSQSHGERKAMVLSKDDLFEAPTNCCMSGCANCVWIQYAEELAELYKDKGEVERSVLKNIKDPNMRAFLQMELQIKL